MKVVIDTQREPVYEHGRLVGHYVHTYTVDRPDVPEKTPRVVTTQAAPTPRRQAVSTPQPTPGFQLECFVAPSTFKEVAKLRQARQEGQRTDRQLPQNFEEVAPALADDCWYTPALNTFQLVCERNRVRV